MKIQLDGEVEQVRYKLRQVLLDVPGASPDSLEVRDNGTATTIVTIPDQYAEHATVVAARSAV